MTARKMNPPVPGHELWFEGHAHQTVDRETGDYGDHFMGGCRCGAKPEGWPNISVNAVKRWHRQHKAELRS